MRLLPGPLTVLVLLVFLAAAEMAAQGGCDKLDKTKPSVYIAFQRDYREIVNSKSIKWTDLKLTNNANCKIWVETGTDRQRITYKTEKIWQPDGSTVAKPTEVQVDGAVRQVFYEIRKSARSSWTPGNDVGGGDLPFFDTVSPGLSVVFAVKQEHSRSPFRLSIPFRYDWETTMYENVDHRTFYWHEFPVGYESPPRHLK